jgi:hypothetical protein
MRQGIRRITATPRSIKAENGRQDRPEISFFSDLNLFNALDFRLTKSFLTIFN